MSQTIDGVFRDFKTAGVPASGDYEPRKPEIRALLKQIQNSGGMSVTRNTKAALEGITPPNENYMGVVLTGEGAGYYSRVGGAWVFGRGFSDTLARLEVVGGTPNAIIAEAATGVAPGDVGAFIIDVTQANTAPVTISINGGSYIPVLSVDGDDYEPGEFTGRLMLENLDTELLALTADPGVIAALVEAATSVAPGTWQLLRDETIAARDVAVPAADFAEASALTAQAAKVLAQQAKALAELAAQIAQAATGPIYPDEPTGRAAVADDVVFRVQGSGEVAIFLYRKINSGTPSTPLPSIASKAAIDNRIGVDTPFEGVLANLLGPSNEIYWQVTEEGTFRAKLGIEVPVSNGLTVGFNPLTGTSTLALGTVEGRLPVSDWNIDTNFLVDGVSFQVLGLNDELIFEVRTDGALSGYVPAYEAIATEVTAARGVVPSLSARLGVEVDAFGMSKAHVWGAKYLREFRAAGRALRDGENIQHEVAIVGDSFSHQKAIYAARFALSLRASVANFGYGDGGHGWVQLGYHNATGVGGQGGNAVPAQVSVVMSGGGWTGQYYNVDGSPDLGSITSSTAGDKFTINRSHTGNVSAVDLHYIGGTGEARYRWNGGAWTAIVLDGAGGQTKPLAGVPAGAIWSLEVEVVSGTCQICGLNVKSASPGIILHNFAATGSTMSGWAGRDATLPAAWNRVGSIKTWLLYLATNDQGDSRPFDTFYGVGERMVNAIRVAQPLADIALISPPENGRGSALPMAGYCEQLRWLAHAKKTSFLDMQPLFGETYAEYGPASSRAWISGDNLHPSAAGGRVESDAILRLLTHSA